MNRHAHVAHAMHCMHHRTSARVLVPDGVAVHSDVQRRAGMLANLKSGRGLFGEEATMAAVSQETAALEDVMDDGTYTGERAC